MRILIFTLCFMFLAGCGNLSPRFQPELRQKIDNQQGKIEEIESNQNSLKNELEIRDSKLDKILNGIVNDQNNNSGLQIFSGSGGLLLGLVTIVFLFSILFFMVYYQQKAKAAEKIANILAENIVNQNNPDLEENIFKAAMHTDVEKKMLDLVSKYQKNSF